ncbi:hypothetical protein RND81_03G226600 [Saponaria officinalis]|uniref:LHY n=1 Tax=Saponaria officinalis TaxID=3572 RepID=A0AAW1M267_SAPOF
MDTYSSSEELLVKTRKPYTITKQRERWTDEEHNKFLEALKLYGRAWQRIEEYIGTKTAVQIRSHAQKFFSKIEKEAVVKGVPVAQAIDLEIPPPRPKRKPSNPYPRKNGTVCSINTHFRAKDGKQVPPGSSPSAKQPNLEKDPQSEESPSSLETRSESPAEIPRKLSNSKESVPVSKTSVDDERSVSLAADGPDINQKSDKPDSVKVAQKNEMHAAKGFLRHGPDQILDESQGTCSQGLSSDVSYQKPIAPVEVFAGHPVLFSNPTVSGAVESQNSTFRSSNQKIHPSLHPSHNPLPNSQEDYSSYLQMSSTFSSLILSVLLQNPAAYAAASSAASLWPTTNVESSGNNRGFSSRPTHPAPSMASIAAATVAAATAWWAAHGLLPLCAPFPAGFPFTPASVASPFANVGHTTAANDKKNNQQHSASKSSATSSSSDSGNSGKLMDIGVEPTNAEEVPPINEQKDTSKVKNKQVDRSSCGSNTPSGSDVETDALGKNDKGNEESKEPEENHAASDLSGRRIRIFGNTNDNWKEVSEEGRMAFQALFSKGRLPQSFSPPHGATSKDQETIDGVIDQRLQNSEQSNKDASQLDLNSNPWECIPGDHGTGKTETQCPSNAANSKDEVLTIGLLQAKLTGNKTGFKPYKRCSVEARESKMINSSNQEQGNCSKRLRVEEEASI